MNSNTVIVSAICSCTVGFRTYDARAALQYEGVRGGVSTIHAVDIKRVEVDCGWM